jgi:3-methyladenine DNA glycosylase AlkC
MIRRRGARRIKDVPPDVLISLSEGKIESSNLMEWLAADTAVLARSVAAEISAGVLAEYLDRASINVVGLTITRRLHAIGSAIALSGISFESQDFNFISTHKSDLVRQWACYAVNAAEREMSCEERLARTLVFAADRNMSVRETAWMAFRPYVAADENQLISRLTEVVNHRDANCRRFAIEVTRPRSVWGPHLIALKRAPEKAESLLHRVKSDAERYVQLAVANWINDASKSRPDWAISICNRWMTNPTPETAKIVKRGLRTVNALPPGASADLFNRTPSELHPNAQN